MRRYPQVGFSAARRSASRRSSAEVDGRPCGRCGWVQCRALRRRCQRNSVSGVTSHPVRLGRASAAATAPSKLRSASVSSGRSTCRRSTASWWRNTMISRSFERPERTASRASDANNRYKIRYTRTQHWPAWRQVNDHGRVSGTHTHIAVPFAHRGLIDQKHRAPAAAAPLGQRRGPGLDHTVDQMPAQSVAPGRRPQRHDPRIRDEPARQTPRQLVLELGMILKMARRAVVAHEPAPHPHQRRAPPRHLQIAHLAPAGVVHPHAAEPARRAARPPHRRLDLHPQLTRRV